MRSLVAALQEVGDIMAQLSADTFDGDGLRGSSEAEVLEVMAAAARVIRAGEALVVEAAAQVLDRCDVLGVANRMTTKYGCRSVGELVQRTTRVSKRAAADVVRAARAVEQSIAPSSGELLPADFPGLREVLGAAEVGVDGVVAVAGPLASCGAGRAAINAADEELAAAARGDGAEGAPPPCADDLRAQATVWAVFLDQDGAVPREAQALRKRGVTLGVCRDDLVPIRGNLLPEVAAQLQRAFDSVLNPKLDGVAVPGGPVFVEAPDPEPLDPAAPLEATAEQRTRPQMQHDALAAVLSITAASGALPTLGGSAPTLVVSVREEDLTAGRGYAHISGCDEPVSISAARHVACSGAVQRVVIAEDGRIVSIGILDRVFNHHQRRAITLRDGGCVIPGCHVPPEWCVSRYTPSAHSTTGSRRGAVSRRSYAHRQRGDGLLVPPSHPRHERMASPRQSGSAGSARALLVGLEGTVAPGHEVADADAGTGRPADVISAGAGARPVGIPQPNVGPARGSLPSLVVNVIWRTLLVMLGARRRAKRDGRLGPTEIGRIRLTTLPTDIDILMHMNNGRYLSLFDLGRWDLLVRTGLWDVMRARGWYAVVSSETVTFRKSLELWQRFDIESRMVGHDDKAVYLEHRAVVDGEVYARVIVRARMMKRSGGTLSHEELFGAVGYPEGIPEVDPWVHDWAAASALPPTRAEAPSVWG